MQGRNGEWNRTPLSALAAFVAAIVLLAPPAGADVVLNCDFNGHEIGLPIPTGGAAYGEPVDDGGTGAIVGISPTTSRALKIVDGWTDQAGYVQFEFLNSVEATTGDVTVDVALIPHGIDAFSFSVREQGGRAENFADIVFDQGGAVQVQDADSPLTEISDYDSGTVYDLHYVFDLDLGIYSLWINAQQVVTDEPYGDTGGRGIGGIYVGVDDDVNTDGWIWVDDLRVETTATLATETGSWTLVKNLYR